MNLIEPVDPSALTTVYPDATFAIRHGFSGHPLFTLPRIIALLQTLPRDRIEYNSGKAAISQDPTTTPMIDLSPAEIVSRIETCNAWMVLKRVETDPDYRALIEQALLTVSSAQGHASLAEAGFSDIQGFIFVSSPHSTTPFHADSEDNFFVQIHGEKLFHVYDNTDRSIASEEMLEDVVVKHRNLTYDPAFEARATHYRLNPGDGIFVPYQWPHYVQTADSYSISLAITWKSEEVRRRNDIFVVNSMLRGLGMAQMPPGAQPAFDGLKLAAIRGVTAVIEPLRRSEAVRRLLRRLALGRNANYYYNKPREDDNSRAA
jgi:ribosomal protein L16 Arg81 hydroxylase